MARRLSLNSSNKSSQKIEARKERHQNEELHRMAQELNDELFEEAGYDFMD